MAGRLHGARSRGARGLAVPRVGGAVLPALLIAGLWRAAPELLKRTMAPPRREAPYAPADFGLPGEEVWFEAPTGARVHAWWIPVGRAAPAVVVLHGWGGNASLMLPLAPHLHRAGFHALFVDARNHGMSDHDDHSSMVRFAEDLERAVAWLRQRSDVTSVAVVGHSVGAGAAILAAARRVPVDALVSVSAFAHPARIMTDHTVLGRLPRPVAAGVLRTMERTIGARFDDIAPVARIADVDVPLLLVHGGADEVVPIDNLEALVEARPDAETLVVPGAGHSDLDSFEPYLGTVLGFLSRHLT